jgi:DNA-binding NtrC family response regulator
MKILLVDDEISLAELLAQRLEKRGHQVVTAYRGGDAIEAIKGFGPEVVLCDQFLPDIAGIQLLGKINSLRAGLPVIMMTGAGNEALAEQALKAGVKGYLEKPIHFERLVGLLEGISASAAKEEPAVTGWACPPTASPVWPEFPGMREAVDESAKRLKRELVLAALAQCGGNRRQAAQLLKVDIKTLYNLVKELNIVPRTVFESSPQAGS